MPPGQGYGLFDFFVHLFTGNIPGEYYVGETWEYNMDEGDNPFNLKENIFGNIDVEKLLIISVGLIVGGFAVVKIVDSKL